jgi:Na+-transporting NADH:ubiquinone oxidoreductase subunit NqrB
VGPPPPRIKDARYFQIVALGGMLAYGIGARDFPITWAAVAAVMGTAWAVQIFGMVSWQLPVRSLLSATISGLSILLLCRSNSIFFLGLVAAIAIASKFVFRSKDKHFFNPTNFGIVVALYLSREVWVSPGQWGDEALLVFWLLVAGGVVVLKAGRQDISFTFLLTHMALLLSRVLYLGQPMSVFFHQLANGSLIIFTFFMISDPRSTPNHRRARVVFAALTAVVGYVLRFHFYSPVAMFTSLFLVSPLTPFLDSLWKQNSYEWVPNEKTSVLRFSPGWFSRLGILRFLRGQG